VGYHGNYETPSDVLHDASLSPDEKIEMLESWRDDKIAYMRATEEGMIGADRPDFLRKIETALVSLRDGAPGR
jgi:hypothetical protein